MLAHGEGPSRWMRGWFEARLADPRKGHRQILDGYASHTRLGMYAGCTEVLAYAAEALVLAGDWPAATRQLDEAFSLADRIGERLAMPRLLLHRAAIETATGQAQAAEVSIRAALQEARQQKAHDVELKCLVALFELGRVGERDSQDLEAAYRGRSEGRSSSTCRRALHFIAAPA
jgi:hypothetical protein